MSFRNVSSNGTRIAIITDEKGPLDGDNYTILLWDNGATYKTHSFHIANAAAIANDWCYDAHGGVYNSLIQLDV